MWLTVALKGESAGVPREEFEAFRRFLSESCGIELGPQKSYLIRSRLGPLLRERGYGSLGALLRDLESGRVRGLRERVIEAMTTNETSWFRDRYPFDLLEREILPALAAGRPARVRMWSAACSTGQEAYSMSMVVAELAQRRPGLLPEVEILGTDISPAVLEAARAGVYDEIAVARGLSPERLRRHFDRVPGGWAVKDHVRRRATFRLLNLLDGYALLGRFHVIFCRNVLIYFSPDRRADILARMARVLEPGGALVLGSSESIPAGVQTLYRPVRVGSALYYRRA